MQAMRRSAVSVVLSHDLTERAARGLAVLGATATLRAAVLGLIALIAGTSAVLVSMILSTGRAVATVTSAPRSTLASVIPSTAIPQSRVTFAVYCTSARATSATLAGRTLGLIERIKMRPNPAAGDFTVAVILPGSIQPGTYHPSIECSDGTSTTARLLVPAVTTAGGASDGVATWLTAGGLTLIGLGAVTGSIVMRRRRRGDPGAGGPGDGGPADGDPGSRSPLDRWQDQAARSRYF
jgi:hypothetical protein